MPGKKSNDKGKRYERYMATTLSIWSGVDLVRTPLGAPEEIYADIWPVNVTDHFPLAVECKCDESWNFDQIMRGTGSWFGWLEQAYRQAMTAERELSRLHVPMLVFSKNRSPDWVAVPVQYGLRDSALMNSFPLRYMSITSATGSMQYVVHELERYLGLVSYERFVRDAQLYL
jgi:hypothetical protein